MLRFIRNYFAARIAWAIATRVLGLALLAGGAGIFAAGGGLGTVSDYLDKLKPAPAKTYQGTVVSATRMGTVTFTADGKQITVRASTQRGDALRLASCGDAMPRTLITGTSITAAEIDGLPEDRHGNRLALLRSNGQTVRALLIQNGCRL